MIFIHSINDHQLQFDRVQHENTADMFTRQYEESTVCLLWIFHDSELLLKYDWNKQTLFLKNFWCFFYESRNKQTEDEEGVSILLYFYTVLLLSTHTVTAVSDWFSARFNTESHDELYQHTAAHFTHKHTNTTTHVSIRHTEIKTQQQAAHEDLYYITVLLCLCTLMLDSVEMCILFIQTHSLSCRWQSFIFSYQKELLLPVIIFHFWNCDDVFLYFRIV